MAVPTHLDLVLFDDLAPEEFKEQGGKVHVRIAPNSPIALVSSDAAGMVLNLSPQALLDLKAGTTVVNSVSGSGATRSLVTQVDGVSSSSVAIPDTDVKPTATAFDPATGLLTTTLSDGTALTANIGIAAVDDFLDSATYDQATASLKLKLKSGKLITVPLSDLVKVTTAAPLQGDGTTTNPVTMAIDPTSTPGILSASASGLKVTLPTPTPTTVKNTIGGTATDPTLVTQVNGVDSVAINLPQTTVSTTAPIVGNGSISSPIGLTIDPTSVGLTSSAAGLKYTASAPIATTNFFNLQRSTGFQSNVNSVNSTIPTPTGVIDTYLGFNAAGLPVNGPLVLGPQKLELSAVTGAVGSEQRSLDMTVNGVKTSLPLQAQRSGLSGTIISWAFPAN